MTTTTASTEADVARAFGAFIGIAFKHGIIGGKFEGEISLNAPSVEMLAVGWQPEILTMRARLTPQIAIFQAVAHLNVDLKRIVLYVEPADPQEGDWQREALIEFLGRAFREMGWQCAYEGKPDERAHGYPFLYGPLRPRT